MRRLHLLSAVLLWVLVGLVGSAVADFGATAMIIASIVSALAAAGTAAYTLSQPGPTKPKAPKKPEAPKGLDASKDLKRRLAAGAGGTILTGGQGLTAPAVTAGKSLLGQ